MKLKYIIGKNNNVVIFTEADSHADIARGMYCKPVSAGFCSIGAIDKKVLVNCWGESVSLNIPSRGLIDVKIIERIINNEE